MKRSPMPPRKTPMPRSIKPMARISPKRAKRNRQVKTFRQQYMSDHPNCEVCGIRPSVDPHEISRGPAREKSLDIEEALLAVCRECHEELGDYAKWPVERQLAVKALSYGGYDRVKVNELRGRAKDAVSERDVIFAAFQIGMAFERSGRK